MKQLTEHELQQGLNQVPRLFDPISFEQVIDWIYRAPSPQEKRWKGWLRRLVGKVVSE